MIPCLIPFWLSEFPLGHLVSRPGVLCEGLGKYQGTRKRNSSTNTIARMDEGKNSLSKQIQILFSTLYVSWLNISTVTPSAY